MLDKAIQVFKKLRDENLSQQKYFNWLKWVEKLAIRKGYKADVGICAYGQEHLVHNPKPIGGGWMFFSKACSGCEISELGLKVKKNKWPRGAPNCALLQSPLFIRQKVKEGHVVMLPRGLNGKEVSSDEKLVPVEIKPIGRGLRLREINPHAAPPPEPVLTTELFESLQELQDPNNYNFIMPPTLVINGNSTTLGTMYTASNPLITASGQVYWENGSVTFKSKKPQVPEL